MSKKLSHPQNRTVMKENLFDFYCSVTRITEDHNIVLAGNGTAFSVAAVKKQ